MVARGKLRNFYYLEAVSSTARTHPGNRRKNVAILARTCPQRTHVLSKVGDSCFLWIVYITWNFYGSLTGLQKSVLFVKKRLL